MIPGLVLKVFHWIYQYFFGVAVAEKEETANAEGAKCPISGVTETE